MLPAMKKKSKSARITSVNTNGDNSKVNKNPRVAKVVAGQQLILFSFLATIFKLLPHTFLTFVRKSDMFKKIIRGKIINARTGARIKTARNIKRTTWNGELG